MAFFVKKKALVVTYTEVLMNVWYYKKLRSEDINILPYGYE